MAATGIAEASYQNSDGRLQIAWVQGAQVVTKWEVDDAGNYSSDTPLGPAGYVMNDAKPMTMSRNKQGRLVVTCYNGFGVRVAISQVAPSSGWNSTWTAF